jgi:peptidoglycan/xylan/chitin deacetylase (PgdA/CDA1 family)
MTFNLSKMNVSLSLYSRRIPAPIRILYYSLKPLIPRKLQLSIRRKRSLRLLSTSHLVWPIDPQSAIKPKEWPGWPEKKQFALILTHDVEGPKGLEGIREIVRLEKELGFRSSFNFVAKKYCVSKVLLEELAREGFEIGVHGLYHDGLLFASKTIFRRRAKSINECLKKWGAVGFRSPSMHQKLEWIHDLNISYDSSTFDTDPFEPQSDGVKTIFPMQIADKKRDNTFVELPYTLPQDFTLFILFGFEDISIWTKKLDWIAEHGGMALINTHPDYMCWNGMKPAGEEYPAQRYKSFLEYIRNKHEGHYWHALPRDAAAYFASTIPSGLPRLT